MDKIEKCQNEGDILTLLIFFRYDNYSPSGAGVDAGAPCAGAASCAGGGI